MEYKICTKCEKEKSINEFRKEKKKKDGLTYYCKQCFSEIYQNNKEKISKQNKKWREVNSEYFKEYNKEYRKNSRKHRNKYLRNKMKNDLAFKLNKYISNAIRRSLGNGKNGKNWRELVGYDCQELKKHLELQFKDGMTWENYGRNGWVIDHRIPLSLFNITGIKSKGFRKAWELLNLQPLWENENNFKRAKLFV